nr:reverse transcriptase domain-containing protein [Tanacetum cinerariifolium]
MADQRTMAQLLQAPTGGYEDAIVVPAITVDNFELKHGLLTLVQDKQFYGHDKEDPHAHIRYFKKITSTLKFPNVPNTLRNEITNFQQRFDESFSEAWDRFKDLLRACPHHSFSELHQLDTFYNVLNSKDQDSLNSAAGGNFLDKRPRECLSIIESKSKVHYSRDKPVVAKVSTNASTSSVSPDVAELKDIVKALLLDKKGQNQSPAPVKAVEENYVTCGGAHSYRNCPATGGNVYRENIQEFVSQASAVNYNQGNTSYRPQMMSNQIRPPGFTPVPNNQNVQRNNQNRFIPNQNQGNNFNQGPVYQPSIFQQPAYQAPAYQAPAPQTQCVSKEDFSAYVKANDAVMKNMQTQAITTRSGASYDGPQIPPPVVENEPKVTKDTVNPTNNENTKDVQPQAVQSKSSVISKPIIAPVSDPKPNPKASILYPSRRNDERNHLGASINLMPISLWKRLSLPDLTPTCMTLELADRSISRSVRVTEDVYVKGGSFHFSADFVVVDFDADPRVPLILERSFLKTGRALIVMFEGDDKLPVIIAKDLSMEEKTTLIIVLKSHKRAIAWKLSDIKGTFQRCMMAIFHDMIEKTMEVFMDDFSVFRNSFQSCLSHLEKMMKRCEDTNLCLNWEKSHFIVKE